MKALLLFAGVLIAMLAVGCVPAVPLDSTTMPPYVVMLTPAAPSIAERCTGVAISPHYILTAQHCLGPHSAIRRVVTQAGQEGAFRLVKQSLLRDLALVRTVWEIDLPAYAEFGPANHILPGLVYAVCPLYLINSPRTVSFRRTGKDRPQGMDNTYIVDVWQSLDTKICGGDSGGGIIQGDKVVGIVHSVRSPWPWLVMGKEVHTIPGEWVRDWLPIALGNGKKQISSGWIAIR